MPEASPLPRVSIVMATYNRSNIIGYSIQSLLDQTVTDWELIVVGDACTDDTEAVVAAFADPRIRFVNMARNAGEQSVPNNEGVRLARAPVLAFLNHDDLWLPDHLERSLAVLDADPRAELVFGIALVSPSDTAPPVLTGNGPYRPDMFIPASLWVLRRALFQRIGPMRSARLIVAAPTQDWLHRAWKSGAGIMASPHLAAVVPCSGSRLGSYADRQGAAQCHWSARMRQPDFPVAELLAATLPLSHPFSSALKLLIRRVMTILGIFPPSPRYWLRYWRKGSFLQELRRRRGLPPQAGEP